MIFPSSFHLCFGFQFSELNRTENQRPWACGPGHSAPCWQSDPGDAVPRGAASAQVPLVKVLWRVMGLSTGHMAAITASIVKVRP